MTAPPLVLVHPGDLDTRTGGFGYDRRLVEALGALGRPVRTLALAGGYPEPSEADRLAARAIFAELPDGSIALVDMLAGGVLPEVFEAERKRLAIVALCHHPLALETGLDPAAAERLEALERRALAAARHVVVTSQATAETLVTSFGVAAERITVALPGTDPRPEAHGDHRPPLLLTVATLTPRKGHDVLIAALADITDLPWVAQFVGGGQYDPEWAEKLAHEVAARGLQARIEFAGEVDDPSPHYLAADIFVLPSRYEGYGMVFAEALAHGLPIVAARAGAVPDVVPEAAGRLVPPDDPDALADALRLLLTDGGAHAKARAASRRAGLALPGWNRTAEAVVHAVAVATGERGTG